MSGYEKSLPQDLINYDAAPTLHDPSSIPPAYTQPPPSFVTHLTSVPSSITSPDTLDNTHTANTVGTHHHQHGHRQHTHSQGTDHLSYVTSAEYPPQLSYEGHGSSSSLIDLRLQQFPEITSYSPELGAAGAQVYVYLQSPLDLAADPVPYEYITLRFGQKQCENAVLAPLEPRASHYRYEISAEVPPYPSTKWPSNTVPLQLIMSTPSLQERKAVEVGTFTYIDPTSHTPQTSNPRKRKVSEAEEEIQRPAKRLSAQQLHIKEGDEYSGISYTPGATSPYSPFLPTPTSGSAVYGGIGLSRAPTQTGYPPHPSPRQHLPQYSISSTASQPSIKVPSPHTPQWSPSFATVNKTGRSPLTPAGRPPPAQSPAKSSANPPLVRTSTIHHSPSSSVSMVGPQSGPAFNPYAMYPHKAVLKLNGDLDTMAENWGMDEWDAKRRLVEFTRRQSGSTIHADFKAIAPEDRAPQSICISCIWWEEKNECYVTSVDTIYLLESLVAVRFTVEEKNRIRRNLEGFRPLTVSKAKPESEEFFKIIMGFPNPKPRNIEKDVKVFPWKILGHALKKIISKYSASYSSTAGALHPHPPANLHSATPATIGTHLTPVTASYAAPEHPEPNLMGHKTNSTRSGSDATSASTYATSLTSTTVSPRVPQIKQSPAVSSVSGPPNLEVTVPTMGPPYGSLPATHSYYSSQSPHHLGHSQGQLQQPLTAPASRSSWDFGSFVNTSPATALPGTSQALNYSRVPATIPPNHNYIPPSYPMGHPASGP